MYPPTGPNNTILFILLIFAGVNFIATAVIPILKWLKIEPSILKKGINIKIWHITLLFMVAALFAYFYYSKSIGNSQTLSLTDETVAEESSKNKDSGDKPERWVKLSEERQAWDFSNFKYDTVSNSFCTRPKDFQFLMTWKTATIPLLFGTLRTRFNTSDQLGQRDGPFYLIIAFGLKEPISVISIPVDGKTNRLEYKKRSRSSADLEFQNSPGNLQLPIKPGSQVEVEIETEQQGNVLQQNYKVTFMPTDADDFITKKISFQVELPYTSLDGKFTEFGVGIYKNGCFSNFEYTID